MRTYNLPQQVRRLSMIAFKLTAMRFSRILLLVSILASALHAQQRFATVEGYVVSVQGSSLKKLAYFDNGGVSLRYGTTDPVISPDAGRVAFIRDHSAFIAPLKASGLGRETRIAQGNSGGAGLLPLNSFIVGFAADSKSLYYSVAPGRDPCPDCPKHQIAPQKADYGLFLYDIATGT